MLKNIEVTQDLLDYIYNHTHPLHPVQKDILTHNKTLGDIQRMQISEIQGHFLQLIIKINNVKNCLEIGRFTGLSALCIAKGLTTSGKVVTIDNSSEFLTVAEKYWEKKGVKNKIESIIGEGVEVLQSLLDRKRNFDLIFIDADKENYKNYYNNSLDLINKDGLIYEKFLNISLKKFIEYHR